MLGEHARERCALSVLAHVRRSEGTSTAPEIDVQGAFTAGGTFPLNYTDDNRYEFQDTVTLIHGAHTIKFGGRLRDDTWAEIGDELQRPVHLLGHPGGYPPIGVYQQNQLLAAQGLSQAEIAALGFGPSEFLLTTGNPLARVNVFDAGVFMQDDWRLKPNFSVSAGLRYEGQSGISDHTNFAPRLGVAWAPGGRAGKSRKPWCAREAGFFTTGSRPNLLMNAEQLNGVNQTQYIIRDPQFFPNVPDSATLAALSAQQAGGSARAVYQVDPRLRVPYISAECQGIERQLPKGIALAVNYSNTRGVHELLTQDINAPLPTVVNARARRWPRPFGAAAGDIYQYEGSRHFQAEPTDHFVQCQSRPQGFPVWLLRLRTSHSDTDGPNSMPANPYRSAERMGPYGYDNRHRGFVSATTTLPLRSACRPLYSCNRAGHTT